MEIEIITFLQKYMSESLIVLASFMTDFGDDIAMILVVGLFYWCLDKKKGLKLCLYLSVVNIFYPMIKNVVKRPRPYMQHEEIECLKPAYDGDPYDVSVQSYSFPSGHMSNAGAVYGGLIRFFKNKILRIVLFVLIVIIGISRFALGVHYPSDVLVGLLLGVATTYLIDYCEQKFARKKYFLVLTVFGLVGFAFCTSNDFYTGYGIMLGTMLGNIIEEKYVNFKETSNIWEIIIRLIGGVSIYFVLNVLLKLPFSETFLESNTLEAHLIRCLRYVIEISIGFGIYPALFRYIDFSKKNQ